MVLRRLTTAALAAVLALGASAASANVWPTSHQRIAKALESPEAAERRAAAAQLGELPRKLGESLARKALRDPDEDVRLHAARAAVLLGVRGAGDEVVEWLSDHDERLRVAACELIEASPTDSSVAALGRVLGDAKPAVRKAAASALGASGIGEAVGALLGHLDDGDVDVRLEVVRALGRIADARAVLPLVSRLQDAEEDVRRAAANALGRLGDARAAATLLLALQDRSVSVRIAALEALGRLRARDATTAIAALLTSGDPALVAEDAAVRQAALEALGRIASPEATSLLIAQLEIEGPVPLDGASAPAPARQALLLSGAAASDALVLVLGASPSERLASAAVLTLGAMGDRGGARARDAVVAAAQSGTVSLEAALRAVSAMGDAGALPFVLEHLDDGDARIRQLAVDAATRLHDPAVGDGRAVDVLRHRLLDPRTPLGERAALARLLGRTGSVRARELLLALAKSESKPLSAAAIEALGVLGRPGPEVDDALLEAIGDSSQLLRAASAKSLARVGGERAARELLHRLGVAAEQDREALGIALSGAAARSKNEALASELGAVAASAGGTVRDALIEALGRMRVPRAGAALAELAKSPDADDRRKVAEALGGAAAHEETLLALAADVDPAVRANAAWSLGRSGGARALPKLGRLVGDVDVAVAGNAAVALARVAVRAGDRKTALGPLCNALADYRSYVRVGALVGLRELALDCPDPAAVRHLLSRDRAWRVRAAAADLLRARLAGAAAKNDADERALERCAAEDRDATVAARCGGERASPKPARDVMVYVVPDGAVAPVASSPFALELADGSLRLGLCDRRGAVLETSAPGGAVRLAVPAALAD